MAIVAYVAIVAHVAIMSHVAIVAHVGIVAHVAEPQCQKVPNTQVFGTFWEHTEVRRA